MEKQITNKPTRNLIKMKQKTQTEHKAEEILNYFLDCFQIKRFIYIGQKEEMLKEIKFMLGTD